MGTQLGVTCRVSGLESGCCSCCLPAPGGLPPAFPEPHLLSLGPFPKRQPPLPTRAWGALAELWHCPALGPTRPEQGESLELSFQPPGLRDRPPTLTLCQLPERPAANMQGLPLQRAPHPLQEPGVPGDGPPAATGVLRSRGLMARSIGVRLAWIKSGFAPCQLVLLGKSLGPSEPSCSDL